MFRQGILWRFLLALVILGVLTAGGSALFRAGWTQGYQAAALEANANGSGGTAPALPYGGYFPYRFGPGYGPFFAPFGLFFGFGFFLVVFFLIGGIFRLGGWRRWGGYYGPGDWGHGHPAPPWAQEWKERQEAQAGGNPPAPGTSQEGG